MNYKDIPLNKRLYVLEDIDCADLKDIVKDRGDAVQDREAEEAVMSDKDLDKDSGLNLLSLLKVLQEQEQAEDKNTLTLATLLEVLDGGMEMEGRMLVITTNYPEQLDKALIRPGRIDMKINFERCTTESLLQMYCHFFHDDLPVGFEPSRLSERRWTPAEATQIFLNNLCDPPQSLEDLVRLEPSTLVQAVM